MTAEAGYDAIEDVYLQFRGQLRSIKQAAQRWGTQWGASGGNYDEAIQCMASLIALANAVDARLAAIVSAGRAAELNDYVVARHSNRLASYDVETEIAAVSANVDAVLTAIWARFPKDANGYVAGLRQGATVRDFDYNSGTPAQFATIVSALSALAGSIGTTGG